MQIDSIGVSHTGQVRLVNEDSFLVNTSQGLWIVADGMGGHENGKAASKMACDVILQKVEQGCYIEQAIYAAHTKIYEFATRLGVKRGMGTTLVLAKTDGNFLDIWWVGDSRAYMQNNETLVQLTHDHSKVQELLDLNLICEAQAESHPHKHIITRSLGMSSSKEFRADHKRVAITRNTKIMLCSDGLSNELSDADILQTFASSNDLQAQAELLIHLSNEKGGRDNITVILLDLSVC